MVAVNNNYFNIDINYFGTSLKKTSSFLDRVREYIDVLKKMYNLDKFLQASIYNIENFLFLNSIDSIEKIDDILIKLEDFSQQNEDMLQENEFLNKWYNLPLRYAIEKIDSSNMSLQAMLSSQQALLIHKSNNVN